MGIYIFHVCLIHIYKEVWEFVETEKKKKSTDGLFLELFLMLLKKKKLKNISNVLPWEEWINLKENLYTEIILFKNTEMITTSKE